MENIMKRITKARTHLVLDHSFFGTLSMKLANVLDEKAGTAMVDGKRIRWSPSFVDAQPDPELMGCYAHEVMHCSNGHFWRRGNRDMKLWNQACDYSINPILIKAGFKLPKGALMTDELLSAEEWYERLSNTNPKPDADEDKDDTDENEEDNEGQAGSSDDRDNESDESDESDENGSETNEGSEDGSEATEGQDGSAEGDTMDPGGCGGVEDPEVGDDFSKEAIEELKDEWRVATSQASRQIGSGQGDLKRMVDEIVNPETSWDVLLRDFVENTARNDYNWNRPSKRYIGRGLVLPSLVSEELPEIVLAIDTSGSVDTQTLSKFAKEASSILEHYDTTVRVVYCDYEVRGTETFTRADMPIEPKPIGGGGTRFTPVFEWIEKEDIEPACLIYLTDLDGRFPEEEPDYPTLWVATPCPWRHELPKVPFGDIVEMK